MSTANVLSCELRVPGQCGNQWTQAFTVSAGAASTLWAYITDSPNQGRRNPRNKQNAANVNSTSTDT
jgi:hypothetical protein